MSNSSEEQRAQRAEYEEQHPWSNSESPSTAGNSDMRELEEERLRGVQRQTEAWTELTGSEAEIERQRRRHATPAFQPKF